VFVQNGGCVQIRTGAVQTLRELGPWFNVMDPDFNLHARTDGFARAFVVRKPSESGLVHSLECYGAKGELLVTLFGERKPGKVELAAWRELLAREADVAIEGSRRG
jgi:putative hemin transport protein